MRGEILMAQNPFLHSIGRAPARRSGGVIVEKGKQTAFRVVRIAGQGIPYKTMTHSTIFRRRGI
jgi:hypothetical protein